MKITKQPTSNPPTEECKSCFGKGYYYYDDDDYRDPDNENGVRPCLDSECVHRKEWIETRKREQAEAEVRYREWLKARNLKENKMKITKEYLTQIIKEEIEKNAKVKSQ